MFKTEDDYDGDEKSLVQQNGCKAFKLYFLG
jgi:hypothetical protein